MKEFIDATIFMGLNHKNEEIRVACKNFFVKRLNKTIYMSLENVGKCDDIIWHFNRTYQDLYYPFMDRLHTVMNIQRIPYREKDITKKTKLPTLQHLTISMTKSRGGVLYTFDKKILNLNLTFVRKPEINKVELKFGKGLEKYYQESLKLRITSKNF